MFPTFAPIRRCFFSVIALLTPSDRELVACKLHARFVSRVNAIQVCVCFCSETHRNFSTFVPTRRCVFRHAALWTPSDRETIACVVCQKSGCNPCVMSAFVAKLHCLL